MQKEYLLKVLFFCLIFTTGCKQEDRFDCIKSTGKIIKEERTFPPFSKLHVQDNINLILVQDTVHKVIVEAGENLIPEIETELRNDRLYIYNKNTCNWVRSYKKDIKVYVHLKDFHHIFNYGYGDINNEGTLKLDYLDFHHYGSGNVNLNIKAFQLWTSIDHLGDFNVKGESQILIANIHNLARLDSRNLFSKICNINTHQGSGDAYIFCDSLLEGKITGKGNVFYSGNPILKIQEEGEGKYIKKY